MHMHTDTRTRVSLWAGMLSTHPACPGGTLVAPSGPRMAGKEGSDGACPFQLQCLGPRSTWDLGSEIHEEFYRTGLSTLDSQKDRAEPRPHPEWALSPLTIR